MHNGYLSTRTMSSRPDPICVEVKEDKMKHDHVCIKSCPVAAVYAGNDHDLYFHQDQSRCFFSTPWPKETSSKRLPLLLKSRSTKKAAPLRKAVSFHCFLSQAYSPSKRLNQADVYFHSKGLKAAPVKKAAVDAHKRESKVASKPSGRIENMMVGRAAASEFSRSIFEMSLRRSIPDADMFTSQLANSTYSRTRMATLKSLTSMPKLKAPIEQFKRKRVKESL